MCSSLGLGRPNIRGVRAVIILTLLTFLSALHILAYHKPYLRDRAALLQLTDGGSRPLLAYVVTTWILFTPS